MKTEEGYELSFPAIRGTQAGREYYVAMPTIKVAVGIISANDDEELPADLRAQRTLNKARIPAITDYIVNNRNTYAFSSLTVSVDSQIEFQAFGEDGLHRKLGVLKIAYGVTYLVNDGQHRRAALEKAIKEDPSLNDEHISLVIYVDRGLKRSQQLFADLNRYVVRPTTSLSILYDHRDPMSTMMVRVINEVHVFNTLTEKEKTTISNRSRKLFTLSIIYQSTCDLLRKKKGSKVTEEEIRLVIDYWTNVSSNIKDWELARKREVSTAELRKETIHAHGIAMRALGKLGSSLISMEPKQWKKALKKLKDINWDRFGNPDWQGRSTGVNGRITKSHNNIALTSNYLKVQLGLVLTPEEQELEKEFNQ